MQEIAKYIDNVRNQSNETLWEIFRHFKNQISAAAIFQ